MTVHYSDAITVNRCRGTVQMLDVQMWCPHSGYSETVSGRKPQVTSVAFSTGLPRVS